MASSYYDSSDKTVFDGDVAEAADLNAVNTSVDTAFQLVEAAISGAGSDASYWAGVAEDWATKAENSVVSGSEYSAKHYAAKAAASASAASGSASAASGSASAASSSASAAATAKTNAETAETNAETAEANAETAQGLAETAQLAAETAQGLAEAAQLAAETAQGLAEDAQTGAETAETNAAASALEASGYEADVVAAGAAQILLVEAEGDDQYARIAALDAVLKSDATGSAYLPVGTTAQRDATPQAGMIRFNSTETEFEGYDGTEWTPVGGGGLIGEIIMWPLDTPPTGFLMCDGTAYAYDDYPDLGELLGGTSGGNFNVPDIDLFPKNSKGTSTLTKQTADVGTHNHTLVANGAHTHTAASGGSHNHSASSNSTGSHTHTQVGEKVSTDLNLGSGGGVMDNSGSSYTTSANGAHSHTITVNSGGAHTHSTDEQGSHDHTVNNYTGTNQPACTLINFCIRAE